jgi:hypothetical protein
MFEVFHEISFPIHQKSGDYQGILTEEEGLVKFTFSLR